MLQDYEDISGLDQDDLEDYDDLGDLSDDEVEDVGAFMEMEGYELEGIINDLGANPRRKKLARAARKIKRKAKRRGVPSRAIYRRAKQKRGKRRLKKKFGGNMLVCGVMPPCAGLLPKNEPIYDTERLASTQAAGTVTFYAIPEGQASSVSGSSITKGKYHTNLQTVKMLPVPQVFDMFGISWCMDTATPAALNDLRNKCAIQIIIGNTPYATLRLSLIPFFSSIQGTFDGSTTSPSVLGWCTGPREMYDLRTFDIKTGILIPQRISRQENFSVSLIIDSVLSMGAAKDISFYLHGIKWTEVRQG